MFTQGVRDTLSLAGISCLSLGMLGASAGIWRSLDARSFTGTTLDATSLEQLTGFVLGLLGGLVLAWLLVCLGLALVARLAYACGHRRQAAILAGIVPAFVARLALAGLGGSLVLATCSLAAGPAGAATAIAAEAPALPQMRPETSPGTLPVHEAVKLPPEAVVPPGETELLSPGWIPHRVPLQMQRLVGGGNTRPATEVVVSPGDSLWSIAARNLPEGASAEEISASWPRWYEANRQLIGPDPNKLYIGMVLQAPLSASLRS
ncbi:LysM domain-containing protein [Paeniglutamicibacter sulfureus]|uniref:LysM peptidoglycan-binding domain-containing protein n=1 Tax=Paeniglutamicibacter sulfureus TaxID=43666 RepID=UPI0026658442|nr:LysM domain-containing protein [Paeniglutamicibacter sulfureus]MDO2932739.1 LysM domain-containing protein [Paeniglutamicibacter sulfureus]